MGFARSYSYTNNIVDQDLDQEHLSNDIGGRCDEIVM